MKRVFLTTILRPLGVNTDTCTENIQAEMYHAQVTLAQGVFSIRTICTGWGLEFIAANLNAPTTVMHYPTERAFLRELRKGYDYVGISFVMCTYPKTRELCELIRRESPDTRIVLGGYGTVLEECGQYADYVCREEGVNFFKRLLGEEEVESFKTPEIKRKLSIMSVTTRPEAIITAGLGCSRGCDFCCTSHFFDQQYVPLLKTGKQIHDVMMSIDFGKSTFRNIGVIDEDFLSDRERTLEMTEYNAKVIDKPILFSCLTSLKSLSQYTVDQLLSMGLSGAWVGIESKKADYPKLRNIDAAKMFADLKRVGINMLASIIVGYDWHDESTLEEDFQYLLSLKPTLCQMMLYSPCPQTSFYERMAKENRLLYVPYKFHDGFHLLFEHPHFSPERIEKLILELFHREYEELGPSVFRVLEVQLMGYQSLKDSDNPLFRARAREYKRLCLEIYPLFKVGIRIAPSQKVQEYLQDLRERVEDQFRISTLDRLKEIAVPALYAYTGLKNWLFPHPQPRTEVHRYNYA